MVEKIKKIRFYIVDNSVCTLNERISKGNDRCIALCKCIKVLSLIDVNGDGYTNKLYFELHCLENEVNHIKMLLVLHGYTIIEIQKTQKPVGHFSQSISGIHR